MKSFIKDSWIKLMVILYAFFLPVSLLYAAHTCPPGTICNSIDADTIAEFIQTLLEGLIRIGIPIAAVSLVWCGFLFIFARGNTEKVTHAKAAFGYTCLGCGVLIGAYGLAALISNTVTALG